MIWSIGFMKKTQSLLTENLKIRGSDKIYIYICIYDSETSIKCTKLEKFAIHPFCTLPPTIPFWSFSPLPGLYHAPRGRKQDSRSHIVLTKTRWGRRREEWTKKTWKTWERRGENEKQFTGTVDLGMRDPAWVFGDYQGTSVLCHVETRIRVAPVWVPEIRRW